MIEYRTTVQSVRKTPVRTVVRKQRWRPDDRLSVCSRRK